jgi:hypothetical protein
MQFPPLGRLAVQSDELATDAPSESPLRRAEPAAVGFSELSVPASVLGEPEKLKWQIELLAIDATLVASPWRTVASVRT